MNGAYFNLVTIQPSWFSTVKELNFYKINVEKIRSLRVTGCQQMMIDRFCFKKYAVKTIICQPS